ncbi:MAG: MerR family transcriptional regulator [Pseudomonadales bacterium]
MPRSAPEKRAPAHYNIGAVARLTGVSREKIRVWERRYGAVTPARDANNKRHYSQQDIERLTLIRRLVDGGQAISSVATLALPALKARLGAQAAPAGVSAPAARSALVISAAATELVDLLRASGTETVGVAADSADAGRLLAGQAFDLMVLDCPTLLRSNIEDALRLRQMAPGCRLLIVYRFAATALLRQIEATGARTVKAPLQAADLEPGAAPEPPAAVAADPRVRQYSPAQLAALGSRADRVRCECPRHLVSLVRDLNAFEDYSLGCETESAVDAAMHREVYGLIAQARALVEDALGIVAAEENLPA